MQFSISIGRVLWGIVEPFALPAAIGAGSAFLIDTGSYLFSSPIPRSPQPERFDLKEKKNSIAAMARKVKNASWERVNWLGDRYCDMVDFVITKPLNYIQRVFRGIISEMNKTDVGSACRAWLLSNIHYSKDPSAYGFNTDLGGVPILLIPTVGRHWGYLGELASALKEREFSVYILERGPSLDNQGRKEFRRQYTQLFAEGTSPILIGHDMGSRLGLYGQFPENAFSHQFVINPFAIQSKPTTHCPIVRLCPPNTSDQEFAEKHNITMVDIPCSEGRGSMTTLYEEETVEKVTRAICKAQLGPAKL